MMKFDKENVIHGEDGIITFTVGCGECCEDKVILNVYADAPRSFNKVTLTVEQLQQLHSITGNILNAKIHPKANQG